MKEEQKYHMVTTVNLKNHCLPKDLPGYTHIPVQKLDEEVKLLQVPVNNQTGIELRQDISILHLRTRA